MQDANIEILFNIPLALYGISLQSRFPLDPYIISIPICRMALYRVTMVVPVGISNLSV